jgi:uncharacterized protein (TIGR00369 family)
MNEAIRRDPNAILQAIPYCRHLGIIAAVVDDALLFTMPFESRLVGNPALPALHGGVIGSLLETASIAQVMFEIGAERTPKTVDITVDYLRSGRAVTSYARARIARKGRRVVNVHAEVWQEDENKLVAAMRGHFLLAQN